MQASHPLVLGCPVAGCKHKLSLCAQLSSFTMTATRGPQLLLKPPQRGKSFPPSIVVSFVAGREAIRGNTRVLLTTSPTSAGDR